MLMSEDTANQPAVVTSLTATSLVTAAFTPPTGRTLIALAMSDSAPSTVGTCTVTDSQSGTWLRLARSNVSSGIVGGCADVWVRTAGPLGVSMTVTNAITGPGGMLVVRTLAAARRSQAGTVGTSGGGAAASSVAIVPTRVGSRIYGIAIKWNGATAMTPNANTSMIGSAFLNTSNGTSYNPFKGTVDTASLASVTYGFTDAAANFNVAMAEITADDTGALVVNAAAIVRGSYW